jgi:hypothetical protein
MKTKLFIQTWEDVNRKFFIVIVDKKGSPDNIRKDNVKLEIKPLYLKEKIEKTPYYNQSIKFETEQEANEIKNKITKVLEKNNYEIVNRDTYYFDM